MRDNYLLSMLAVFIVAISTTSCGTIFIGTRESISFHSNLPSDTPVRLVVDGEQIGHKVYFPINVMVKRGYSPSFALAEAEGYKASSISIQKEFHPATLANLLIGGIIGFAIDLGSGAISQATMKSYQFVFEKDSDNENNSTTKQNILPKTYKIGDFYQSGDKTGIVVYITEDGMHGKIVSLSHAYKTWDNALEWCHAQGKGWHIPTINEMNSILINIGIINAIMATKSLAISPDVQYWTSAELSTNKACVATQNGAISKNKNKVCCVLAVSDF